MGADSEQGKKLEEKLGRILRLNHFLPEHADYPNALRAGNACFQAGVESVKAAIEAIPPDGYAHRYPDGIRFGSNGQTINGSSPIETLPLYYKSTLLASLSLQGRKQEATK